MAAVAGSAGVRHDGRGARRVHSFRVLFLESSFLRIGRRVTFRVGDNPFSVAVRHRINRVREVESKELEIYHYKQLRSRTA